MSNSSPDSSLNRSTSSTDLLKLIIKAANQKYEDFIVDQFELDWTIKRLKIYLTENYPQKPEFTSIRLIYSGKMLHDHWSLSECIRHNSEVKSHIIHLVLSSSISTKTEVQKNGNSSILSQDHENDAENELTPDTSSLSSSLNSSSSSILTTPIVTSSNINNEPQHEFHPDSNQRQQQRSNLTPKQQYEQIYSEYLNQYQAMGIRVQDNAWYSTYVQQLALYQYMYSNYLQSQISFGFQVQNSNLTLLQNLVDSSNQHLRPDIPTQNENQQPEIPQPPPQARPVPAAQPPQPEVERDDDWLSLLHTIVSFLVLFSIIYYYSSLERFLVIFAIVVALVVYHNGWLSLQRRQVHPRTPPQANNENEINENADEPRPESISPNFLRLFFSFIFTFFTSLIPERPRVVN